MGSVTHRSTGHRVLCCFSRCISYRESPPSSHAAGLITTRQIAIAHGGDIHVTSSAESGTRFSVALPR